MPCFSVFPQFYRLTSLSICSILFHTQSIQYIFICLRVSNKSVWLELLNLQEFLRASLIISADMGGKKNQFRTPENDWKHISCRKRKKRRPDSWDLGRNFTYHWKTFNDEDKLWKWRAYNMTFYWIYICPIINVLIPTHSPSAMKWNKLLRWRI